MFNGIKDITILIADEGKVFKRKGHNEIFGNSIALGYSYYIDGVKLETPYLNTPEDFEEIDDPNQTDSEKVLQIITGQWQ